MARLKVSDALDLKKMRVTRGSAPESKKGGPRAALKSALLLFGSYFPGTTTNRDARVCGV